MPTGFGRKWYHYSKVPLLLFEVFDSIFANLSHNLGIAGLHTRTHGARARAHTLENKFILTRLWPAFVAQ